MRAMIAVVVLALMAPAVMADGTKADFEKYGQPIVNDFADCILGKADAAAKGYKTDEGAANDVIDACREHLDQLKARMKQAPFDMSDEEAALNVQVVENDARGTLIKEIMDKRKH